MTEQLLAITTVCILCYHSINLFTSFFIGGGSSWKREEGPSCKPCGYFKIRDGGVALASSRPPIADSTASDATIAEDTMIDEFSLGRLVQAD